ncbi:hypothetical protein IW262DRAFT_1418103 [Armillaria fumosa]|nr:hypothetical protein IW262DRAFT_1418103 [Armillaria fumosa]
MTMDLTRSENSQPVALENFTHIIQTTSRNTPRYHYIFAQCYWFVYTIWKILEMEMHPHIALHHHHARHCVYSAYPKAVILGRVRTPETVKSQWDAERTRRADEWAGTSTADRRRAEEAEAGRRQAEEGHCQERRRAEEAEEGRRQADAQIRELQAKLEASEAAV